MITRYNFLNEIIYKIILKFYIYFLVLVLIINRFISMSNEFVGQLLN